MAKVLQAADSGELSINRRGLWQPFDVTYLALQVPDEDTAVEVVREQAPKVLRGLSLTACSTVERLANGVYKVTVSYGKFDSSSAGTGDEYDDYEGYPLDNPEISVDVTPTSAHMSESLARIAAVSDDATIQQLALASNSINVDSDGNVQGVDVSKGVSTYQELYYLPPSHLTARYIKTLQGMVGSVNNAPFRNYDTGEVMFDGASFRYQRDQAENVGITFKFKISPNAFGMPVGNTGWVMDKFGWDYAWIHYAMRRKILTQPGGFGMVPDYAVIDRVAPFVDFSLLGIGR